MSAGPQPTHGEPAAIHPVPAEIGDCGFRLLVLREFRLPDAPPAFALVDQHLLRAPQRLGRHGVSFAATFRPEVVASLSDSLGRPSLHDADGRAMRNPRWPRLSWHAAHRLWPDGTRTTEWSIAADFPDAAAWAAFRARWHRRLAGGDDEAPRPPLPTERETTP